MSDLRAVAADLYRALVSEHGHGETHSADWPACLPVHIAMNRYQDALNAMPNLDVAWAEAEAATRETGRSFLRLTHNAYDSAGVHYDYYYAACNWIPGELGEDGSGPTPAAALLALAAKLRERP